MFTKPWHFIVFVIEFFHQRNESIIKCGVKEECFRKLSTTLKCIGEL